MNEVFKFQGADIRVIEHEGRRVAYMPDVAQVFGLRPNNVIPALDPWDYVTTTAEFSALALNWDLSQGRPSPYWLTESGINHLSYKLSPELRQAVNEEILPSIRRTGGYTVTHQLPVGAATGHKPLTAAQILAQGVTEQEVRPDGTVVTRHDLDFVAEQADLRRERRAASKRAALVAAVVHPMPNRYDTPARRMFFDTGLGNWEQGEEAIRNMLWSNDPPAGVDFHRLVEDTRRTMRVNFSSTIVDAESPNPHWRALEFVAEQIRRRVPPLQGGWAAPELSAALE